MTCRFCSTAMRSWMWLARSWASAASVPGPGSSSLWPGTMPPIRSSSNSRKFDASVLEPQLGTSPLRSHAERVIDGQRVMQSVSDVFLGWTTSPLTGVDYYWRQLWDWKGSAAINSMRPEEADLLRQPVWAGAGFGPRSWRRSASDGGLPGQVGCIRPRDRGLRRGVRRADRPRLRSPRHGREAAADQGRPGDLTDTESGARRGRAQQAAGGGAQRGPTP